MKLDDIYSQLAAKIANRILSTNNCYSVVVPIGFDGRNLPGLVAEILKTGIPNLAHLQIDTFRSPDVYAERLAEAWGFPLPEKQGQLDPNWLLSKTISLADHKQGISTQLLDKFHKFVDHMEPETLSLLRGFEQEGSLRTITFSIYPYDWLAKYWKKKKLVVSEYGNSPSHIEVDNCRPLGQDEICEICRDEAVPDSFVHTVKSHSGGIPEVVAAFIQDIKQIQMNDDAVPNFDLAYYPQVHKILKRIVDKLDSDPIKKPRFADFICNIYAGVNVEEMLDHLKCHPWKKLILNDEHTGLRTNALGDVIMQMQMEKAATCPGAKQHVIEYGYQLYQNRNYLEAAKVFERIPSKRNSVRLMKCHSQCMAMIHGSDRTQSAVDWDYTRILNVLVQARKCLEEIPRSDKNVDRLLSVYKEITSIVSALTKVPKGSSIRIVDYLVGLCPQHPHTKELKAAFFLLYDELDRSMSRNFADAIGRSKVLPEQILRLWAHVYHDVNFYKFPQLVNHADIADLAKTEFLRLRNSELRLPDFGEKFTSIDALAFFVHAKGVLANERNLLFHESFEDLSLTLNRHSNLRNSQSHAVYRSTQEDWQKLSELIHSLLEIMILMPVGNGFAQVERKKIDYLLALMKTPLPLSKPDDQIIWID